MKTLITELLLLVLVSHHLQTSLGERLLLLGGYQGYFGQPDAKAVSTVETLQLDDNLPVFANGSWCSKVESSDEKHFSPDGSVAVYLNNNQFAQSTPGINISHRLLQESVLVCGGADSVFNITDACHWYWPGSGTWTPGPRMSRPRYQAAVVSRPGNDHT